MFTKDEIKNKIFCGDSLDILKKYPDKSVDLIITSPPYWKLREYEEKEELGDEEFFVDYVENLCRIFDECKRVLKNTGSLWLNIGDTFLTNSNYTGDTGSGLKTKKWDHLRMKKNLKQGVHGSLSLIPERVAISMTSRERGWCLKMKIIWYKVNSKPSSAYNKFGMDWEPIYVFTKNRDKYYFKLLRENYGKRAMRSVWPITIAAENRTSHIAVFPEELVARVIDAGCPSAVCIKCGMPMKINEEYVDKTKFNKIGFKNCECNAGYERPLILDPFMGSGTTGIVAARNGINYTGIDKAEKFVKIAEKRISGVHNQIHLNDLL